MNQPPAALLFDMDGLLLDTEGVYKTAWTQAAAGLGFQLSDALFLRLIGITIADCEKRLQEAFGPEFPLETFRENARVQYEELVASDGIPLKPGVRDILSWAESRGIPCGVGTSTVTDEARERLQHHDLLDRFATIIGGDQISHGKPDPEIFLKVAGAVGQPPERCLVLEDAHSGILAAHAGGIPAVLIPDLLPATPEIEALCEGVFSSLIEVRDWLDSLGNP